MYRRRRVFFISLAFASLLMWFTSFILDDEAIPPHVSGGVQAISLSNKDLETAKATLEAIPVKGRAPKTNYARTQFGNGWRIVQGCDTRNTILARDLTSIQIGEDCKVDSGLLNDPYTGDIINFERGPKSSSAVQIDHVVALSNAWQTGAQQLSEARRIDFANDPLNLLAVDGPANQQKGDSDAASWLPRNKAFRCPYIVRQVEVKKKYDLWVTPPEKIAMTGILNKCTAAVN